MDLFEWDRRRQMEAEAPLAARMRPRTLDEVLGQEHLLGPGRFLRRAIAAGKMPSCILFGPPGTGKTTLARLAAAQSKVHFEQLNAVTASINDLRRVVAEARERRRMQGQATLVFIDEIHRWSKAQQDALLPFVEEGEMTLVGATTHNPLVYVIPPLVSRVRLFELKLLGDAELAQLMQRALADPERGLGNWNAGLAADALDHIVRMAGGDARAALNGVELAVSLAEPDAEGRRVVDLALAEEALQKRAVLYDKDGDEHYHVISAFIKSIRGSDPDAALYWLARMLYAGEDPRFVGRRLLVHAAEDIGNADPTALLVATAAAQSCDTVGMPECRIPLAQATIYLACAPKSNAAKVAIDLALADVKNRPAGAVPRHLRDTGYGSDERLGHGRGYLYPHDFPGHWVEQSYLPPEAAGVRYLTLSDQGREPELAERLAAVRGQRRGKSGGG